MAGSRSKKILAIDWDARTLRVVHALITKHGVSIDRILSVAIPADVDPLIPEAMGRFIRGALDQEGIHTRGALVDIPRDQAILKTLTLPSADPDTLAGIVRIQIAKELPFPVDGAVIDFAMEAPAEDREGGDSEKGTVDVLVAAVRYELRDQFIATLSAAGLKLERIGLRPYASKIAVCRLLEFSLPERVLIIDVRSNLTEIDVLRNGQLSFSRAASVMAPDETAAPAPSLDSTSDKERVGSHLSIVGGGDSVEATADGGASTSPGEHTSRPVSAYDRFVNAVILEITRSIEAYRSGDPGSAIDHVVIGGDVGVEEQLGEAIQSRLHLTTELYNPATTFGWEPDEGAAASAFSATLGLVLGYAEEEALHFDFLHPKRPGGAAGKRWMKAPSAAAVLLLFLAAAAIGVTQYRKDDRALLRRMGEEISRLERNGTENRKFERLMGALHDFDEGQHVWVDVLYDVLSNFPPNQSLVIDHIDMQQGRGRLVLKTKTKERDTALDVIRKLEAFRRAGRSRPRFKVTMGPQSEKKGEAYPFVQDLRVDVLNDASKKTRQGKD